MANFRRGDVCGVDNCQSSRWIANGDGTETCANGHNRQRYGQGEEEEYHFFGETTRRKTEKLRKLPLVPKGKSQANLLLLAHQHILRSQVWWLMKEKGFPAAFEALVRELWAQRVNVLADKIDDAAISVFETARPVSGIDDEEREIVSTKVSFDQLPTIDQSLALCYLAAYILHIPLFIGDIMTWVNQKQLPFIGCYSLLPPEMRSRMGAPSKRYLRDQPIPMRRLHFKTHGLMMAYQQELGLRLPTLNSTLCLYRVVEWLALPLDVYMVVKELASLLSYTFDYPTKSLTGWLRDTPDGKLAGFVMFATKLLYPFDQVVRHPRTDSEPAALMINWNVWQEMRAARNMHSETNHVMKFERARGMTENQVLRMPTSQADQYMEWFRHEFAERGEEAALLPRKSAQQTFAYEEQMFKMFPIDSSSSSAVPSQGNSRNELLGNLRTVQSGMNPRATVADSSTATGKASIRRPGSKYRRHRTVEAMSETERALCENVAAIIGMTPEQVLRTTTALETEIDAWARTESKSSEA